MSDMMSTAPTVSNDANEPLDTMNEPPMDQPGMMDMMSQCSDLAMALDTVIDEVGDALAQGDVASASALVTAAGATADAMLSCLGVPMSEDVDEVEHGNAADGGNMMEGG